MAGLWRTPRTWVVGETVGDTHFNQQVRDQLNAVKNDHALSCGRLTLTSGTPVTRTDVLAATTIYFTPLNGNIISLHDGSNWQPVAFPETAISLGTDPANVNTDIFGYYNGGSLAIEKVSWINTGLRAAELTRLDGVRVKASDTTRRHLGTYRTTATGQTEDSGLKRLLWNQSNRRMRPLRVIETTDSWTYTTEVFRQANNSAANQVAVLIGETEDPMTLFLRGLASNSASATVAVGIGEDSTTNPITVGPLINSGNATTTTVSPTVFMVHFPIAGYHEYKWLELSVASGTTTWYGDAGVTYANQSGMNGWVMG